MTREAAINPGIRLEKLIRDYMEPLIDSLEGNVPPGSGRDKTIDSNSFGDTLWRFEEACRAGREHGNYSASYVSDRIIGKDSVNLMEFDAGNSIISVTTFKVNVVYLNQK